MNWRARVRSAAIHSVEQWQEGADAGCDPGRPQPDRVLGLGDQGSEFCGGSREPVPGVIDRASAFTAIVRPLVPLPARVNVGEPARGMLTGSLNARRRISRPCVPRGVSVGHIGPLRLGGIRRLIVTGAEGIRVKCRFRVHGSRLWRGSRVRTPARPANDNDSRASSVNTRGRERCRLRRRTCGTQGGPCSTTAAGAPRQVRRSPAPSKVMTRLSQ